MIYHTEGLFHIAFGDERTHFNPKDYKSLECSKPLLEQKPFNQLKHAMKLKQLVFLHQVHSNYGLIIESQEQITHLNAFSYDGDFIITNKASIGLAIATADCLPIIIYSPLRSVVAIVHAGWRGSMQQVAVKAIEQMQQKFKIPLTSLRIFFGPSAQRCCYEVGQEVLEHLNNFSYIDEVLTVLGEKNLFDLSLFNQLQLQELGIPKKAFNIAYNLCTICDTSFCSYRREKNVYRQMTVVALK